MIWFMAPDLPTMSGGLRVIDRYVTALNDHGLPARVWHGRPLAHPDAVAPTVTALPVSYTHLDV